jgi:hypothetical protein
LKINTAIPKKNSYPSTFEKRGAAGESDAAHQTVIVKKDTLINPATSG